MLNHSQYWTLHYDCGLWVTSEPLAAPGGQPPSQEGTEAAGGTGHVREWLGSGLGSSFSLENGGCYDCRL